MLASNETLTTAVRMINIKLKNKSLQSIELGGRGGTEILVATHICTNMHTTQSSSTRPSFLHGMAARMTVLDPNGQKQSWETLVLTAIASHVVIAKWEDGSMWRQHKPQSPDDLRLCS